jgi:hypothetical protein
VQLLPGPDEFRWNLHKNGEFSVDSMYKALIQLDIPVDSNKMIWKMKIPLKPKFLGGIFVEGWSLPKTILLNKVGMGVKYVFLSSL